MSLSEDDSPFATACRATARAEFVHALNQLRERKGLSYQQVADNSGDLMLPKSTAHAMCTITFPKREGPLRAFLTGCRETPEALEAWVREWRPPAPTGDRTPLLSWSKARPGVFRHRNSIPARSQD